MSGYLVLLDGSPASDPRDDAPGVISARLSQKVNAAAWLDLRLSPSAAAGMSASARVEVDFGGEVLFLGRAVSVATETDGTVSVEAVSDLDALTRVLAPPHSTDGSAGERCPDTLAGYFSWLLGKASERPAGGVPVFEGENQGASIRRSELAVSEGGWRTVAELMEDHVLSVGGYLVYEQHATSGTVSLMADISSASAQVIGLGENLLSIGVTRGSGERRSAVVASGAGGLTLEGAGDDARAIVANSGMMLSGAAVYDPGAVSEHGWSEEAYDCDCGDAPSLARAAVARLRTLAAPRLSVTCRAIDMSLYADGYAHLGIGQAVRVRSAPHGVDEYLVVQGIDLDMEDPSQSTYELGVAYDTLTGQQSAYLRRLNGGISHALEEVGAAGAAAQGAASDAAAALGKASEAEEAVAELSSTVSETVETAEGAMTKATEVSQTVDGLEVRITALDSVRNLALATGVPAEYSHDASESFFRPVGSPANSAHGVGLIGAGGELTLSFDWAASGVTSAFELSPSLKHTASSYSRPTWTSGSAATVPPGDSSGHFSRSFRPTSGQMSHGERWLMSGAGTGANDGARLVVTNLMLEAGGEEHAWRPAPEDVADAARTATNYLRFDGSGLAVGDMEGELRGNVLLGPGGVQVRNGEAVLSSFGASSVSLCSGRATVASDESFSAMFYGSGTSVFGDATHRNVQVSGGTTHLGSAYSGSGTYVHGESVTIGQSGGSVRAFVGGAVRALEPVYRLTNPYQENTFIFLPAGGELNGLVSAGWKNQGVVWYAFVK